VFQKGYNDLKEIIKSAVREELFQKNPEVISASKLSDNKMRQIMNKIGMRTIVVSILSDYCIIYNAKSLIIYLLFSYVRMTSNHLNPYCTLLSDGTKIKMNHHKWKKLLNGLRLY